jgi:tRNA/tmRNA/rRNA uracil-C5-methylase (TrmA/RlmC/RlmD family)
VVHVTGRIADLPEVDAGIVVNDRPRRVPHGVRHDVLGRSFEVSAGGFWQVHPGAATVLAQSVLDGLEPQPGDRVVDLYAGVGLFAALIGERVGADGSVLALEGDARACADAARNTADQPQVKVRTVAIDASTVASRVGRPDLLVLDPPRAGAGTDVARAIVGLRPRRVAYVACDPATFARDLKVFVAAGWELASLRAFDVFPMTEHVELVGLLHAPNR